ncbi:MAG: ATP-binding cassette domain-containing protein [Bacteroidota bacterium]
MSRSGKTTLLHLLAGLRKIQTGTITFGGTPLHTLNEAQRDRFRGNHIGLVFQQSHFVSSLSILENLLLAQKLAHKGQDTKRALTLLESLGLGEKAKKKPRKLSQGEQQRAAIARALVNDPQLILADEPTASLDDQNCRQVSQLLREQAERTQAMLLIVTHDTRLKAAFSNQIHVTQ